MRETIRDIERLRHILEAIDTIEAKKGLYSYDQIMAEPILFYGFVKLVEIIGEAGYMLTVEFKANHAEVPWRAIESMRHVLVHGYYTISKAQLQETLEGDIPYLRPFICKYIEELS